MTGARRVTRGMHKVGLTAGFAGLAATLLLSFGRVRPFRLATGEPVSLFASLPVALALVPLLLWVAVIAFSFFVARSRNAAFARGLLGGALVVALFGLSGVAASLALDGGSSRMRYSMGGAVWTGAFFALTLILGSRRELGLGSVRSWFVVLLAPVGVLVLLITGRFSDLGMAAEYRNVASEFLFWAGQHLMYAGVSIAIALVAGVSLGILAYRYGRLAGPVFAGTSVVQTIPGLAMVGLLAIPLGVASQVPALRALGIGILGWAPVVLALTLYALLVLVRNTYTGLASVPAATIEAGQGMGLTRGQLLRKVELPLASPVMFAGARTAIQQTIGTATLAYFVAAGSLGRPIFSGVSQGADDLVLLGSIALVALALAADIVLRGAERLVVPHKPGGRS